MTIWYDEEAGGWKNKVNPLTNRYERTYVNGWRIDAETAVKGAGTLIGLWIVIAWAYIFIADYTWTTAAVVTGVLVALSLLTVGIRRTTGGIFRFIWWAILMAVMTDVEVRVGGSFTDNMHGVWLPFLAVVLMFAVWLYSTVKITRLVF
jgi:hypothetical protein